MSVASDERRPEAQGAFCVIVDFRALERLIAHATRDPKKNRQKVQDRTEALACHRAI